MESDDVDPSRPKKKPSQARLDQIYHKHASGTKLDPEEQEIFDTAQSKMSEGRKRTKRTFELAEQEGVCPPVPSLVMSLDSFPHIRCRH